MVHKINAQDGTVNTALNEVETEKMRRGAAVIEGELKRLLCSSGYGHQKKSGQG